MQNKNCSIQFSMSQILDIPITLNQFIYLDQRKTNMLIQRNPCSTVINL